jgi:hypothetical protein
MSSDLFLRFGLARDLFLPFGFLFELQFDIEERNVFPARPDLLSLGSNASGFFMLFNTHNESLSPSEL